MTVIDETYDTYVPYVNFEFINGENEVLSKQSTVRMLLNHLSVDKSYPSFNEFPKLILVLPVKPVKGLIMTQPSTIDNKRKRYI